MQKKNRQGDTQKTARQLAVECLVRWDRERQALQPYLEQIVYRAKLSSRDRHLVIMIIQGVLRQLQYLDGIISGFSRFPARKMKPLTLMALRVGVFQLMFLERIPDSAAVNETVQVMKTERQPRWLISFTNGVLRNIARNKPSISSPDKFRIGDELVTNHPEWLVSRWQDSFGPEKTRRICIANSREPELVLRVNTLLTTPGTLTEALQNMGLTVQQGRYAPDSMVLESHSGPVTELPGYADGLFHVQDEAAQLASFLLAPFDEASTFLDACAGLGGKSCHMAQLADPEAHITAVEPSPHRFVLLNENIRRLHLIESVHGFQGQLDEYIASGSAQFQRILVDAPCSGTGVTGRHPDIRWNRQPGDLQRYQDRQVALLQQASSLLLPGGVLVYATCSLEAEENQQVVEIFLHSANDFSCSDARQYLPASAADLVDPGGYFCPTPAEGLDGFFAARLTRNH